MPSTGGAKRAAVERDRLVGAVAIGAIGALVGYLIYDGLSQEGFGALQGVFIGLALAAVIAALLGVGTLAFVGARLAKGRRSWLGTLTAWSLLMAVGLGLGAALGYSASSIILGRSGYQPDIVKTAVGSMTLDMPAIDQFVPHEAIVTDCTSMRGSDGVWDVVAPNAGQITDLSGGRIATLRASVDFTAGRDIPTLTFSVDGAALALGYQPTWVARVLDAAVGPNATTGTAVFVTSAYRLDFDTAPQAGAPTPGATWPGVLSGTLSWQCAPWAEVE